MSNFERTINTPDAILPERKTAHSAGYDFTVLEDTIVPSYLRLMKEANFRDTMSLEEMADFTKTAKVRPTLVRTGIKCKLADDEYLALTVRSSCPLKYWLIMANSEGIIDSDYYGNKDNDGDICFQLINLSPADIILKRGDVIGQGIIHKYYITENDNASGKRTGGFGSTSV